MINDLQFKIIFHVESIFYFDFWFLKFVDDATQCVVCVRASIIFVKLNLAIDVWLTQCHRNVVRLSIFGV